MEQKTPRELRRGERRWTLIVAPLGTAVVFLSVLVTAEARDLAYVVALASFGSAIPLLSMIAFLTSLREEIQLPRWWEENATKLLLAGHALVAIGIGAALHRVNGMAYSVFVAVCLGSLGVAAVAVWWSRIWGFVRAVSVGVGVVGRK